MRRSADRRDGNEGRYTGKRECVDLRIVSIEQCERGNQLPVQSTDRMG